ncbi:7-deoxyloganetin glucosyltransferase-like [Iris pallida]|nr:7-deoxyloganetin glucosyltransferase-like [Iris pallida]
MSGLITHRKPHPLLAIPHANSVNCWMVRFAMLPKFTYITDPGSLPSSQSMQLESSSHRLDRMGSMLSRSGICDKSRSRGPMGYTGGRIDDNASRTACSKSSKVCTMIAEARSAACASSLQKFIRQSLRSVVLK